MSLNDSFGFTYSVENEDRKSPTTSTKTTDKYYNNFSFNNKEITDAFFQNISAETECDNDSSCVEALSSKQDYLLTLSLQNSLYDTPNKREKGHSSLSNATETQTIQDKQNQLKNPFVATPFGLYCTKCEISFCIIDTNVQKRQVVKRKKVVLSYL